jgi:hypothetical protein
MSSRSSALCPQCRERRLVERERHGDKLAEAYGKASQSEYERIKSERPPKIEDETMGEYYEWEFTSEGKFWFHFHFSCDVCGFHWTHNGETQYPLDRAVEVVE